MCRPRRMDGTKGFRERACIVRAPDHNLSSVAWTANSLLTIETHALGHWGMGRLVEGAIPRRSRARPGGFRVEARAPREPVAPPFVEGACGVHDRTRMSPRVNAAYRKSTAYVDSQAWSRIPAWMAGGLQRSNRAARFGFINHQTANRPCWGLWRACSPPAWTLSEPPYQVAGRRCRY
jgi:hypothetical protein